MRNVQDSLKSRFSAIFRANIPETVRVALSYAHSRIFARFIKGNRLGVFNVPFNHGSRSGSCRQYLSKALAGTIEAG